MIPTVVGSCRITNPSRLIREPTNLGSEEEVTINQMIDIVEGIDGLKLKRTYRIDAPKGDVGRSSDNTRIFCFASSVRPRDGLAATYEWNESRMLSRSR